MATTTRQKIVCACGHAGAIACTENDAPYSSNWERHTLEGFDGNDRYDEPYFKGKGADLIAALAPMCPSCGKKGKVRFL